MRRLVALALGTCAFNTVIVLMSPQDDWEMLSRGSLMLWLCLAPVWHYILLDRKSIPFAPTLSIVYFLSYGRPAFESEVVLRHHLVLSEDLIAALNVALCGQALFLVGYYLIGKSLFPRLPNLATQLNLSGGVVGLAISAVIFGVLANARLTLEVPIAIGQVVLVASGIGFLCAAALVLVWLRGLLPPWAKVVAIGVFAASAFLGLGTGSVGNMRILATPVFVYIFERKRVPLVATLVAMAVLAPFMVTKMEFRRETWGADDQESGSFQRAIRFVELTLDRVEGGQVTAATTAETVGNRVNHLGVLAHVIATTPSVVPYWGGDTYWGFAWSFVPRLLYPAKPTSVLGQDFGHRYGLLSADDDTTSLNFEQLVEMYANFGVLGVVVGMSLLGILYRLFMRFLVPEHGTDAGALIASVLMPKLLAIESDFSLVHGLVIQSALIYFLYLRLLTGRSGRARWSGAIGEENAVA